MRTVLPALTAVVLLGGCAADLNTYYDRCQRAFARFNDQFACARDSVAKDSHLKNDRAAQALLQEGQALAAKVDAGRLSDAQAQRQFAARLEAFEKAEIEAQGRIEEEQDENWNRPRFNTCVPTGHGASCTSY